MGGGYPPYPPPPVSAPAFLVINLCFQRENEKKAQMVSRIILELNEN